MERVTRANWDAIPLAHLTVPLSIRPVCLPFIFLGLPPRIRYRVYELLLIPFWFSQCGRELKYLRGQFRTPGAFETTGEATRSEVYVAIVSTCRQICLEACQVLYYNGFHVTIGTLRFTRLTAEQFQHDLSDGFLSPWRQWHLPNIKFLSVEVRCVPDYFQMQDFDFTILSRMENLACLNVNFVFATSSPSEVAKAVGLSSLRRYRGETRNALAYVMRKVLQEVQQFVQVTWGATDEMRDAIERLGRHSLDFRWIYPEEGINDHRGKGPEWREEVEEPRGVGPRCAPRQLFADLSGCTGRTASTDKDAELDMGEAGHYLP